MIGNQYFEHLLWFEESGNELKGQVVSIHHIVQI